MHIKWLTYLNMFVLHTTSSSRLHIPTFVLFMNALSNIIIFSSKRFVSEFRYIMIINLNVLCCVVRVLNTYFYDDNFIDNTE